MRNLVFSLTLFLTITVSSQQRSYHEDAMKYFDLNGTEQQYSKAIDQMYDLLKKQYSSLQVPDQVWDTLQNNKTSALTAIKSLLVSAYRSNFIHDDIKKMITFYETDAGQQMVKDPAQLSKSHKSELSVFFTSDVGKKVQQQSASLKQMVEEVSELWSRDLYHQTIAKLETKGYQLPK